MLKIVFFFPMNLSHAALTRLVEGEGHVAANEGGGWCVTRGFNCNDLNPEKLWIKIQKVYTSCSQWFNN